VTTRTGLPDRGAAPIPRSRSSPPARRRPLTRPSEGMEGRIRSLAPIADGERFSRWRESRSSRLRRAAFARCTGTRRESPARICRNQRRRAMTPSRARPLHGVDLHRGSPVEGHPCPGRGHLGRNTVDAMPSVSDAARALEGPRRRAFRRGRPDRPGSAGRLRAERPSRRERRQLVHPRPARARALAQSRRGKTGRAGTRDGRLALDEWRTHLDAARAAESGIGPFPIPRSAATVAALSGCSSPPSSAPARSPSASPPTGRRRQAAPAVAGRCAGGQGRRVGGCGRRRALAATSGPESVSPCRLHPRGPALARKLSGKPTNFAGDT